MKRSLPLVFLILIFVAEHSYAQRDAEDSLKRMLDQNIPDTLRVRYLLYFADRSDPNNRSGNRMLLDSADRVAQRSGNKTAELNVLTSRGLYYYNMGKVDSSLYYYNQVLAYEDDTTLLLPIARACGNMVNCYRQKGDLETALKYALKSESYALKLKRPKILLLAYANIGGILFDLKDIKKTLEYDKKVVWLVLESNFDEQLSSAYRNLGTAYGENGFPDSAMFYYKKSLQVAEDQNIPEDIGNSCQTIGNEFFLAGNSDSAYAYLYRAKNIYEGEEIFDESYPMLYCYLGNIETQKKNYNKAEMYLAKADSASETLGILYDNLEIKKALKDLYAAKGDWLKAFYYQEQYIMLNDSLHRDENIKITRELERRYDIARHEKENAELKAANEIQEQKISAGNKILFATVSAVSLLVLLLFFIFRNYRNEKKHVAVLDKLNTQLTSHHDEILKINQLLQLKVLRTQMNPHFIYNCLNGINNLVVKGESDKASSYLLNFSKLLRMILDFSDKTFIDLEDEIKFIHLYLSLESMRMGNDFSYEVNAPPKISEDDIGVPSLLIQPFIENAIWHGLINKEGDKKLSVNFEQNSDTRHLICIVEDNGIGREKAAETKRSSHTMLHESKGIRITQERIELLQYQVKNEVSVTICDKTGAGNQPEGTLVKLVLPVNG